MWGWSPGDGTFGTGTYQYLRQAKKKGVRIVCVDPRRTRTSRQLADEHIFIKPSTDAAALIAMAYVIASEGLHDQAYCDAHVLGFDEAHLPAGAPAGASYLSYLNGVTDGVKKTPEWAAAITRHSGRDDPPPRHRVRHHQAGGAAVRLCAGPHGVRRAVPSRRLCAGRHDRQRRHQRRQLGRQQRRHRPHRHQEPAGGHQSDRCAGLLAAAGRSAGARQELAAIRPTSS